MLFRSEGDAAHEGRDSAGAGEEGDLGGMETACTGWSSVISQWQAHAHDEDPMATMKTRWQADNHDVPPMPAIIHDEDLMVAMNTRCTP